jgi:hypothetical protein
VTDTYDESFWVLMESPWFAYEDAENYESPGSWTESVVNVGTPEPSPWAMMLLGFAGLGFAGHRRARAGRAMRAA